MAGREPGGASRRNSDQRTITSCNCSILNKRSGHALTSPSIHAGTFPEHIPGLDPVAPIAARPCVCGEPSSPAAYPYQRAFLCAPALWLSESSRIHGDTSQRNEHDLEPTISSPPSRNGTGRSASRDKLTSKFSLSSFRNRHNDHSPAPSAIESLHIVTSDAIQRAPASPGLMAHRAGPQYDIPAS